MKIKRIRNRKCINMNDLINIMNLNGVYELYTITYKDEIGESNSTYILSSDNGIVSILEKNDLFTITYKDGTSKELTILEYENQLDFVFIDFEPKLNNEVNYDNLTRHVKNHIKKYKPSARRVLSHPYEYTLNLTPEGVLKAETLKALEEFLERKIGDITVFSNVNYKKIILPPNGLKIKIDDHPKTITCLQKDFIMSGNYCFIFPIDSNNLFIIKNRQ